MNALAWHESELERLLAAKAALPHALLLRGPHGVGKLIFARALAQALLCEAPTERGTPCGECTACAWFASNSHPDYRQVEPGSDLTEEEKETKQPTAISVGQIRALESLVNVSSHRGGPKIVVIHPAEALNVNAANAFLKNLEEPPPRTHFLLVAHRPHLLLPTIKSRCRQLALRKPDAETAVRWLHAQGVADPAVALAHTGGTPLTALELARSDYWGARTAFLRELARREFDVLAAADAVPGIPPLHVIAWLQKWSYDIVHQRAIGTVRYNPDYADSIAFAARQADPLAALRFHREMVKLQPVAQHPLNARLFVEHLLIMYRDVVQPQAIAA